MTKENLQRGGEILQEIESLEYALGELKDKAVFNQRNAGFTFRPASILAEMEMRFKSSLAAEISMRIDFLKNDFNNL